MTEEQLQVIRQTAQARLISFSVVTDKMYKPWDHHYTIAKALERVERWETKRLIISVPPRHWKSRLASQEFPAFYLWRHPEEHVMVCSYSSALAETFSRRARERLKSNEFWFLFDAKLKEDVQSIKSWETDKWWWFIAAWVGWSITWKWFNIWIIDAPISNREEAESELIRNKIWDWYTSTFYTRQEKDAAMIVIMTRWHEDDLAGRLISQMDKGGEKWEVLHLKAISDDGHALWEDKYNIDKLEAIKNSIWPRDFNSLYQWEPFDEAWGSFNKEMFQYFDYEAIKNRQLSIMMFIDPAISLKESADYTAIVTIWRDNANNIYILDVWRERAEPDEIINNLFKLVDDWKPERVWIEVVAYQKMLALEIKKQMQLKDRWFTMEEVKPMGEKEARIKSTLQPRYSNRNIFHNHKCQELETELLRFPNSKHDDIIDSLSWAVKLLDVNTWNSDLEYSQALSSYLED